MSEVLNDIITLSDEKRELLELLLRKQGIDLTRSVMTRTRRDTDTFPLSFAQQRLWFLSQLEPDSPAYNIPLAIRIKGKCDHFLLERAFREITQRHEILRTRIAVVGSEPAQIIQPSAQFSLQNIDLTTYSVAERELRAHEFIATEARRPFDLSCLPLMRVSLLNIDKDENILLIVMHHILADGWSMGVLVNEVRTFYEALASGNPSPLPPLPVQYADFAAWQRRWLTGETLEKQLGYWKSRLADAPGLLPQPTDRPRTAMLKSSGSHIGFEIPSEVSEKLKPLLQHEGVTLYMILLAAFNVLLHRFTAQQDISIGTPIANRNRKETEGLIGFFVNTLVMRTDLSGNPTFFELLHRVREYVLGAYDHQDIPFEMLVDELHVNRDLSYTPLFQVMFDVVETSSKSMDMQGLELSFPEIETGVAKFDLMLEMSSDAGVLKGEFEYNTDLFDESTIERFTESFRSLLGAIVSRPSLRIGDLQIMSDEASNRILVEWNSTGHALPASSLMELFEAQVGRSADAIAVRRGDVQVSYRELNSRANQLAHHLIQEGVAPESIVGLCIDRSVGMLVAILGILKAGGAYLPLDPAYPAERIAFMCSDSGVKIVIAEAHNTHLFANSDARILLLDQLQEHLATLEVSNPLHIAGDSSLAYVIYTSGSTGMPKGVLITRRSVINHNMAVTRAFGLTSTDRVLQFASLNFDAAVEEILPTLLCGATLVLRNADVPTGSELLQMIRDESLTVLDLPTAYWSEWVYELSQANMEVPESIRLVIVGGERVPPERYAQWKKSCRNARWLNTYGPTETTIISTLYDAAGDPEERWDVPIGRPISNSQAYVLDEHLHHVPIGVEGELYIGGMGIARGYLNRPAITAERFVPDPFAATAGSRMYRTGDQVRYLPDGNLLYVGRRDQQVKLRGFRVEVGEIEAALSNHTHVREAVVEVKEDSSGEKRLVAFCVPAGKDELTPTMLREHLRTQLPEYMIPAVFVTMDSLPHTPNGKIDRKALTAPEQSTLSEARNRQLPRSTMEEIIASIWSELLHLERVSIEDNFFELGGHSLLATRLVSRIRQVLGLDLPLRAIFETPTVAGLARVVEKALESPTAVEAPPLLPVERRADVPLSFAQQRLWFLDQLEPNSPFYNMPEVYRINGPLQVDLLESALNAVVERHEILRTAIITRGEHPVQEILPTLHVPIPVDDVTHLPDEQREAEAMRIVEAEAACPIPLDSAPLFRVKLIRLAADECIIVVIFHHIISDDWSSTVMMRDLAMLYDASIRGEQAMLPELPIQYADYSVWQRQWLTGDVLETQLAYWRTQLADIPSLLTLPTDRPRPAEQTFNGSYITLSIPQELTAGIRTLGRSQGTTLFMTLLAAWQTLLSRYSGQDDICVGTPIANRTRAELEGLIGFFVNTLVLRASVADNPSFSDLLHRVRETTLGAYAHQDVPFEKLVDVLHVERNLSHSPLFQVMFTLQQPQQQTQALSDISISTVEAHSGTAKFDLTLFLVDEGERLSGALEFNTDLFDHTTVERMAEHFRMLLASIVAQPDAPLSTLNMLSTTERTQQLVDWNGKTLEDDPWCVHERFARIAAAMPDTIAIECQNERITYSELNTRANQLARYLQAQGIAAETLVGLSVERSVEMIVGMLGILKTGAAYVPLESTYPQERLAYMLNDAQIRFIITTETVRHRLPVSSAHTICLDTEWKTIAQCSGEPGALVAPENLAYVIYTSGSTGTPKGTLITHRGLSNYLDWCLSAYPVHEGRGSIVHSTLAFDATVTAIFPGLMLGKTLTLVPETEDITALADTLKTHKDFSLVKITPAHLELLRYQLTADDAGCTRSLVIGGENLTYEQIAFWQTQSPTTRVFNEYGPTETVVGCIVYEARATQRGFSVPIGRAIPNTTAYILDKHFEPTPVGVAGELYLGGVGVARGYINRAELTAERFVPDPFCAGQRLYRTGDLVRYRSDGQMEFLGRIDHQAKIKGYRIELGEIESTLQRHPSIKETVVVARDNGEKRLVAYLVTEQPVPTVGELRDHLKASLPDYMVPSAFVMLDALPLTPHGKVDKRALPKPSGERTELATYVAPRTEAEVRLAAIWQELLGAKQVGVRDNFFELGGDSITSIQVIARARQAGLHFTPKDIFQHPTIEDLVTVASTTPALHAEQGIVTGPVPLTPIQHWFFDQHFTNPHHWNQSVMVEVDDALDPLLLEKAVAALLEHHDALRLQFEQTGSGWQQTCGSTGGLTPFKAINLSEVSLERVSEAITTESDSVQSSLNITNGPLFAVAYFNLGNDQPSRLLFVAHHLVMDAISWQILLEDFESAYRQLMEGKTPQLPLKTSSFKAWASALENLVRAGTTNDEAQYWQSVANDTIHPLVFDYPPEENSERSLGSVTAALDHDDTLLLLEEARQSLQAEPKEIILAALTMAISKWMDSSSVFIDIETHGREELTDEIDVSRTVGWFTSIHPLLITVDPASEGVTVVDSVKNEFKKLPRHGIGFGLLKYLATDSSLVERMRLFPKPEIIFNYFGHMRGVETGTSSLRMMQEATGVERSLMNRRTHQWELTGGITDGCLTIEWAYSNSAHTRSTIAALADSFINELKSLIAHSHNDGIPATQAASAQTFGWSENDMADILSEIEKNSDV